MLKSAILGDYSLVGILGKITHPLSVVAWEITPGMYKVYKITPEIYKMLLLVPKRKMTQGPHMEKRNPLIS